MGHTQEKKSVSKLEEYVKNRKKGHTTNLEKCVTLGGICHTWRNGSHLEKLITRIKMRQI